MRVTLVLVLLCQLAHASPPGLTPVGITPEVTPVAPPPADEGLPSYRAQTLIADGIAAGLLLVAINEDNDNSEALAKLSLGTYLFGAPLVHLTKNRSGRALASVTMRIGFPVIGGLLGESMRPKPECDTYYDDYCQDDLVGPSEEMVVGVILGVLAASVVDSAYLARGEAPKPQPQWTPTAHASPGGFALGVNGTF
ncbi:MAG TPA: hypothetical protein VIV11_34230 [Kofleriaceae bacterium]